MRKLPKLEVRVRDLILRPENRRVLAFEIRGFEPPTINRTLGLHWVGRHRATKFVRDLVALHKGKAGKLRTPVRVFYARSYASRPCDEDGLAASAKALLDAFVRCGALEDDRPECVSFAKPQQFRRRLTAVFGVQSPAAWKFETAPETEIPEPRCLIIFEELPRPSSEQG